MRYNGGMYDDNYGCPCTDIQRFFVSERYPLKNLLPLVELQYRIDELYKRLDE
ncbi:MAG TPA: hypothetical protein VFS75_00480 [Candidatus Paceibacterota bacterium]|nr:hypothetical protein [Candidatus Paceibacterota bacterium]